MLTVTRTIQAQILWNSLEADEDKSRDVVKSLEQKLTYLLYN